MLNTVLESLPAAAQVTEQLVARYGAERLWQVEQLSRHIFRAWLTDGGVALATVMEDGGLQVRELEAV